MRAFVVIFLIMISGIVLYGESIHEYKIELFGKIKTGDAPEELEYSKEFIEMAGFGNLLFKYYKGQFYIRDEFRGKVKVFDNKLKFIKELGNFPRSKNTFIDSNGNLLIMQDDYSVEIYNTKGKAIAGFINDINQQNSSVFSFLFTDDLFMQKNDKKNITIFNLNARHILADGRSFVIIKNNKKPITLINEKGNPEDDSKAKAFVDEFNKKELDALYTKLGLNSEIKEKLNSFIAENNTILYNGKILTPLFEECRGFYNIFKQNKNIRIEDRRTIPMEELSSFGNIGFDSHNNSYWKTMRKIGNARWIYIVLSQYGELLDCFYSMDKNLRETITVSDEGDIYLYDPVPQDDYMQFYRIKNVWDPIDTSVKADTTTKTADTSSSTKLAPAATFAAKATSIIATSFIDYQSMYTPYRVFDNDPKTAWLEAVKGSGTDESVSLALDKEITVDEIRFLPGYFDKQWWQANNRIKKMVVAASGQALTFTFEDKMEEQAKKLDAPLAFSKIKFIINAVYRSTGDDDTALSEISFYNAGKKLELDVSGVK